MRNGWRPPPPVRAEWVKLVAALVNREDIVNKKFDSVEKAYNDLAQLSKKAATHPRVIIGMPFKGTWYTPAGRELYGAISKRCRCRLSMGGHKGHREAWH